MTRFSRDRKAKFIFIFCEGYTEEHYFNKINQLYRNTPVQIKNIKNLEGDGNFKNIENLNKEIQNSLRNNKKFKEVKKLKGVNIEIKIYAIFDLDCLSNEQIKSLYDNIDNNVTLIGTNMCFEYWILSHFEKYDLGNGKREYLGKIKNHISISNDKFTGRCDFDWLNKENIKTAIKNTKEVNDNSSGNLKNRDPYSNVYEVIEFLEN